MKAGRHNGIRSARRIPVEQRIIPKLEVFISLHKIWTCHSQRRDEKWTKGSARQISILNVSCSQDSGFLLLLYFRFF